MASLIPELLNERMRNEEEDDDEPYVGLPVASDKSYDAASAMRDRFARWCVKEGKVSFQDLMKLAL